MTDAALAERLCGRWHNTQTGAANAGIAEVVIEPTSEGVRVGLSVIGAAGQVDGPIDWGWVTCGLYECWEEDRMPGAAGLGTLTLEAMSVELQLRVNKGVLCVMSWTRFADEARHDYVTRELFARARETEAGS